MTEERMRILKMIEEGTITADEGAKLLEAVDHSDANEKKSPSSKRKYGVRHFLGDAVDKIKKGDFDLTFGEYVEFEEEEDFSGSMKDMDIAIANGSLKVRAWDHDYVQLSSKVRVYQVETNEEARQVFATECKRQLNEELLHIESPSKKVKVDLTILVPDRTYDLLKARLKNGSITISDVDTEHVTLKTSNGKVFLEDIEGQTCKIETGNGSVTIEESEFDTCEVDTINGSITLEGEFGKSDVSAVSGSITVNHEGIAAHTGFYKTTTGSVTLALPKRKQINGILRTKMGSIQCDLDNYKILKDKKEVVNKLLEFEAQEEFDEICHVEAETKTGSVTVTSQHH